MRSTHLLIRSTAAIAAIAFAGFASAATMTFNGLGGANGDNYTSYSEAGLTFTKTAGSGCVGQVFGNPVPDIFGGPTCDGGTSSSFSLTGGTFRFNSVDLAANNGLLSYSFVGKLGASTLWTQTGTLAGPSATFATIAGTNLLTSVDSVLMSFTTQGSSFNIDNIGVTAAVPEPSSVALIGAGLVGLVAWRRRTPQAR